MSGKSSMRAVPPGHQVRVGRGEWAWVHQSGAARERADQGGLPSHEEVQADQGGAVCEWAQVRSTR